MRFTQVQLDVLAELSQPQQSLCLNILSIWSLQYHLSAHHSYCVNLFIISYYTPQQMRDNSCQVGLVKAGPKEVPFGGS